MPDNSTQITSEYAYDSGSTVTNDYRNLPVAGSLTGDEVVPIGGEQRTTTQAIADLGGGGSGLVSYQNSAMSSPVMAYVYKDESDNIYRVYEPIRNNDVSRSQFAYADSIDKVPFDNTDWFNNRLLDVKLINVPIATIIQGCTLKSMVINATSKTGIQIINTKWKGNYGTDSDNPPPNGAELYIVGNDLEISGSTFEFAAFVDSIGKGTSFPSFIHDTYFGANATLYAGGGAIQITDSHFAEWVEIDINDASYTCQVFDCQFDYIANVEFRSDAVVISATQILEKGKAFVDTNNISGCFIGVAARLNSSGGAIDSCSLGDYVNITPAGATGKRYININDTAYEMGFDTGAMTLTPV